MDPIQRKKEAWYNFIVYLVTTLASVAIGTLFFVGFKRSRAARPAREQNFDILSNRIAPVLRREIERYPDKQVAFVASMADKTESGVVSFTNSNIIITPQEIERV